MDELSPSVKSQFVSLQKHAKLLAAEGLLEESLAAFKKALAICRTEKILLRIKKLEDLIKNCSDEEDEMVEVAKGFSVHTDIYKKLYNYQKDGVAWMWSLYKAGKGGVLGDDMGLGKTFQIIAFLSGMFDANLITSVLIIMPVSLMPNWKNEFKKWSPGITVYEFHGTSKKKREQDLNLVQRRGGVIITSYGMTVSNYSPLSELDGRCFVWDYVILDEGHRIKNPTKATKCVHEISSRHRIVITGTPIQNNLRELWALYDFTHRGTLLGTQKTFKLQYEIPITRAREKDSSAGERKLGNEIAQNLKELIKPYFLRRTKQEVFENQKTESPDSAVDELGKQLGNLNLSALPKRNDFVVWVILSEPQYELYTSFLNSDAVKTILVSTRSPLVELNVLKKICDHPRLLPSKACKQLGLDGSINEEHLMDEAGDEAVSSSSIENVSDDTLINESGKLRFTIDLLENLRATGHRTLVFSLSRKILDMIQRILTNRGWKILRIDGTISKMEDRHKIIHLFQTDSSWSVFLLTTQIGGVGITLTAADRVIVYDPSWNPATDAQAVDRAFRIGQNQEVIVYRLITCGSIEEKIYRRQIFKDSVTRQAVGSATDPHRYFSKQELKELFVVGDIYHSDTQVQLSAMHSPERKSNISLDEHIKFLHSLNIFGISDHDLLFSKEIVNSSEENYDASVSHDYIKKRVEMARQLVQHEASIVAEGIHITGSYMKPYTLSIPSSSKKVKSDSYRQPEFPDIFELGKLNFTTGGTFSLPKVSNRDEASPDLYSKGTTPTNVLPKTSTDLPGRAILKSVEEMAISFPTKETKVDYAATGNHMKSVVEDGIINSITEDLKINYAAGDTESITEGAAINCTTEDIKINYATKDNNVAESIIRGTGLNCSAEETKVNYAARGIAKSVADKEVTNNTTEDIKINYAARESNQKFIAEESAQSVLVPEFQRNDKESSACSLMKNTSVSLDVSNPVYKKVQSWLADDDERTDSIISLPMCDKSILDTSLNDSLGDLEQSYAKAGKTSRRKSCVRKRNSVILSESGSSSSTDSVSEVVISESDAQESFDYEAESSPEKGSVSKSPLLHSCSKENEMFSKINSSTPFIRSNFQRFLCIKNKEHDTTEQSNSTPFSLHTSPKAALDIQSPWKEQKNLTNLDSSNIVHNALSSPRRITPLRIFETEPTACELQFQSAIDNSMGGKVDSYCESPSPVVRKHRVGVIASDSDESPVKMVDSFKSPCIVGSEKKVGDSFVNRRDNYTTYMSPEKASSSSNSESFSDEESSENSLSECSGESDSGGSSDQKIYLSKDEMKNQFSSSSSESQNAHTSG